MASPQTATEPVRHSRVTDTEYFDPQPTPRIELPDPVPFVERLALLACEILAGSRNLDQIARWVTEDVYRTIAERSVAAKRLRAQATDANLKPPLVRVSSSHVCEPRDGIVEGVVLVTIGPRMRAVAIRLEGLDHRWRASTVALL